MLSEYCIGVIGIKNPSSSPDRQIIYNRVKYERLMDKDVNITLLLADIRSVKDFCLKPETYDDKKTYLGVYFQPYKSEKCSRNVQSKYRIISTFFDVTLLETSSNYTNQSKPVDSTSDLQKNSILSHSDLYSKLRDAHQQHMNDVPHLDVKLPYYFLPNLRTYQLRALQWMLHREKVTKYSDSEYVSIKCYSLPKQPFYFNYRTKQLMDYDPGSLRVPKGGILADEMGLGKTVEMLALILCHPKLKRKMLDADSVRAVVGNKLGGQQMLKCICYQTTVSNKIIQCPECLFFQHEKCVTKYSNKSVVDYICPGCWKLQQPIESSTTLIVSPSSIKMQWYEEIEKHIFGSNLKVLVYNGIKNGWISPRDLAAYDVVLTDYAAMQSEIHFTNDNNRQMVTRSKRRNIIPASPLTMINWWRVVLDEAQMVETPKNNCSRMVKSLPAENRWSVTGTPIEKSIDNLYGLMVFLDYEPFTDLNVWNELTEKFNQRNAEPLINKCLKNVMWRTSKINVTREIGLPPQTEIVHKITMSDLQAFYYSDEHQKCAEAFYEKARQLDKSLSMVRMNVQTLKMIMEPLRKLRQDCTNPTTFQNISSPGQETVVKKVLLAPEELLKHMISKNEISCKESLKIIARNLNGIASLQISKGKFDIAAETYKSVICWAEDYTGTVCVDLLLQVHAVHNLLEIFAQHTKEIRTKYSKELERLERKYFENTNKRITTSKVHQVKFENSITDYYTNDQIEENNTFRWWKDYLIKIDKTERNQIMKELRNKLRFYKNTDVESITAEYVSFHDVIHKVSTWLAKLQKERKELQKSFMKLDFFSENLKSGNVLSAINLQKIDVFVQSALHCHLDTEMNKDTTSKKQIFCLLCKVRNVLDNYECLLFDKIYGKTDFGNRNPNPCYQEVVLKVIHKSVKIAYKESVENEKEDEDEKDSAADEETDDEKDSNADEETDDENDGEADGETDDGKDDEITRLKENAEKHRKLISLIKYEFKEYKKYWDEINRAAVRYNDLEMCKSHVQVVDVDNTLIRFRNEEKLAKENFFKFWGILNYLKQLENETEPKECPICIEIPTTKYCVLQCGHTLCYPCYLKIAVKNKTNFNCCVCRHSQKITDVNFVTCDRTQTSDTEDDTVDVTGIYSQKIKKIVATALKLREQENDVKIIIFSHWESILNVIANALLANGIKYREKSVKFNKSIEDFKNKELDVTCLLLPLASGSKGLNLIEATHVFLVEPILNPAEEYQAIGRIHRIGQTKPTFVHRFIVMNTIEENIFKAISNDHTGKWKTKEVTVDNLKELFTLKS